MFNRKTVARIVAASRLYVASLFLREAAKCLGAVPAEGLAQNGHGECALAILRDIHAGAEHLERMSEQTLPARTLPADHAEAQRVKARMPSGVRWGRHVVERGDY